MGITSINMAMSASSWGAYNEKLTEATKQKLAALNIPYNNNMTEAEGKALVNKALQDAQNNSSKQEKQSNNQSDLYKRALHLAEKLGIGIDEELTFEQLIAIIESKLEEKINANQNNEQMLLQLKSYSKQLANIQAESTGSSGFDSTNQALMMSLEMLGEYNKSFLNK